MRGGAIFKINPVILEFVRKDEKNKNDKKYKTEVKNSKFKDGLVKFMFNHRIWEHIKYR